MKKQAFPTRSSKIFKSYIDALSFFTVFRFKSDNFDGRKSVYSFVLTGLTIGAPPFLFFHYLSGRIPADVVSIVVVLYFVLITGALHLDGLADTADGLFSCRSRERMLEIMKDSRIGTMGAVAIIMVLIIKVFTVHALKEPLYLLLIPAYARYGMVFGLSMFKYARETGTAAAFFGNYNPLVYAQGIILLALSWFLGLQAFIAINAAFAVFIFLITRLYKAKIGGITGDMLGAMSEACEAFLLIIAACL